MTEDEQEARSHKYHALGLLPLSSGRFALFFNGLVFIDDWLALRARVPTVAALFPPEPEQIQEINLEELDL